MLDLIRAVQNGQAYFDALSCDGKLVAIVTFSRINGGAEFRFRGQQARQLCKLRREYFFKKVPDVS